MRLSFSWLRPPRAGGVHAVRSTGVAALALAAVACSVLVDKNATQCTTDGECRKLSGTALCQRGVCVASGLGPPGCFLGTPQTTLQYANQCAAGSCIPYDNCAQANLCGVDAPPPSPPMGLTGAGGASGSSGAAGSGAAGAPASSEPAVACVEPARKTIYAAGTTNFMPFAPSLVPLLAKDGYALVYQGSSSCAGVTSVFSPDPAKHLIKNVPGGPGKTALYGVLYQADAAGKVTSTACSFPPEGVAIDVAPSDVYSTVCKANLVPTEQIGDYLGPVEPMVFVVNSASQQHAISYEAAQLVFGNGGVAGEAKAGPWVDYTYYFFRRGGGTQQLVGAAIDLPDVNAWWGLDRGSVTNVRDQLVKIDALFADRSLGILSTDLADAARSNLRVLAYQGKGQLCGYVPDSAPESYDKRNVRDGHYGLWGRFHFFTPISQGLPSNAAGALVTRFTLARLDQALLDAIIDTHLVPSCAMHVQRTSEVGPLTALTPEFGCGCYFEARVNGGSSPCARCNGPVDCPSSAPACNLGFCEAR